MKIEQNILTSVVPAGETPQEVQAEAVLGTAFDIERLTPEQQKAYAELRSVGDTGEYVLTASIPATALFEGIGVSQPKDEGKKPSCGVSVRLTCKPLVVHGLRLGKTSVAKQASSTATPDTPLTVSLQPGGRGGLWFSAKVAITR